MRCLVIVVPLATGWTSNSRGAGPASVAHRRGDDRAWQQGIRGTFPVPAPRRRPVAVKPAACRVTRAETNPRRRAASERREVPRIDLAGAAASLDSRTSLVSPRQAAHNPTASSAGALSLTLAPTSWGALPESHDAAGQLYLLVVGTTTARRARSSMVYAERRTVTPRPRSGFVRVDTAVVVLIDSVPSCCAAAASPRAPACFGLASEDPLAAPSAPAAHRLRRASA